MYSDTRPVTNTTSTGTAAARAALQRTRNRSFPMRNLDVAKTLVKLLASDRPEGDESRPATGHVAVLGEN